MKLAFIVILFWCFAPLVAALVDWMFPSGLAPLGYEDATGFHYGEEPASAAVAESVSVPARRGEPFSWGCE